MSGGAKRAAILVIAVVAIGVHATSLGGDFVYDDHRFIEHNQAIRSVPVIAAFTDPATASHGEGIQHDIYRPLRTLLFALEYQAFAREGRDGTVDFHLWWWHLVSVLLHALNACLVFLVVCTLLRGAVLPALLGALVFALHPLTSESVAWISSQGDLLAMTLLLSALLVMDRPGPRRTIAGALIFLLACLAKESALMLPLLLPLRDAALPRDDEARPSPWAQTSWVRAGVLAAVACGYFVLRTAVLPGLAQVEHADGSVLATARGMLHGMGWYAQALLMPLGFSFDTRIDVPLRWTDPEVWIGFGILGTLIAAGVAGFLRKRYVLAFAALGFLVALGPVSNVIVPLKTFVADRFVYPGLLCVAAAVGAALTALRGTPRSAVTTVLVCAVVGLGALTTGRNAAWAGERQLWEHVRADRPWNANAYQGIAYEYLAEKRIIDAENALATYLEANPFDGKSMYAMGNLFGELAQSLVRLEPDRPGEVTNVALRQKQAYYAQIALYRRAFEIWVQPAGLERGRGSPRMLADMLDRWITAGVLLGDTGEAKFANDQAIDLEAAGAYRHADFDAVWKNASWVRRSVRVQLALQALRATTDRSIPEDLRKRVLASRAAVLRDIGLDPASSGRVLWRPLIRRLEALLREASGIGITPDPIAFADLAGLYLAEGDPAQARSALERGLRLHVNDAFLLRQLQALPREH